MRKNTLQNVPDTAPLPAPPEDGDAVDKSLMARTQRGDDEAFAELIQRHQRPLMNFFVRSGVYTDAEDFVQETFLRLHRYRMRYRPSAKFTTFLYLLARQVRIDALRRMSRRTAWIQNAGRELPQAAVPTATETGEALDVLAALARLSDAMREVVVLATMQGMTQEEVAEVLGIPVGTVKSRLSNAIKAMREDLGVRHEKETRDV